MSKDQDDVVARGADVPLKLAEMAGPRDALLDPRPDDIIPDNEEKGYHVGEIRQPAEPVLKRSGDVAFESLPGTGESKFVSSYAADVAALDKKQQGDPLYEGRLHVPIEVTPDELRRAGFSQGAAPAGEPRMVTTSARPATSRPATRRSAPRGSATAKVNREAASVASAQREQDSSGS